MLIASSVSIVLMSHLISTLACSLFLTATALPAHDRPAFPLWPEGAVGAPDALGERDQDKPTRIVCLPDSGNATGAAMVICHGGCYGALAKHVGCDFAL